MAGFAGAASKDDEVKAAAVKEAAIKKVTRKIDAREISTRLPAAFDNEKFWQKVAAKCVSCGVCTFLCPTCYCFDINDEMLKGDGARYRNWDSLQLSRSIPRCPPKTRARRNGGACARRSATSTRFIPSLFGEIACTGCGRCIRLCPVNWDITQVLSNLPGARYGEEIVAISDISQRRRYLASGNVYLPHLAVIEKIVDETPGIRNFHFNFKDKALKESFTFESGQFGEYSIFGIGEATFCVSSSPTRRDHLEFAVQRAGKVTNALHRLGVGAEIGFRGPYGNSFPLDYLAGKNLVFVAGGIGLAPLRSLVWNVIDNRDKYGNVDIIYGARSPLRPLLQVRPGGLGQERHVENDDDGRPGRRTSGKATWASCRPSRRRWRPRRRTPWPSSAARR